MEFVQLKQVAVRREVVEVFRQLALDVVLQGLYEGGIVQARPDELGNILRRQLLRRHTGAMAAVWRRKAPVTLIT